MSKIENVEITAVNFEFETYSEQQSVAPNYDVLTPVNEEIRAHQNPFFKDEKINVIDEVFSQAKRIGLTHLTIDDSPHNGKTYSVAGKEFTSFANCSYLGLEIHENVKSGAIEAVKRYGLSFNMSRAYGSNPLVKKLESMMEEITGENCLLTLCTGRAHEAFMSVMIQPGDVIILDQQVHTTVQVAAKIGEARGAKISVIPHNDLASLERKAESLSRDPDVNNIWYLGDGLYSMYGDFAPVQEIIALLEKYPKLYCYLDDAHGLSILGKNGKGFVLSQQERLHQKMIVALSLGKSFGMGQGGCLVIPNHEWHRKISIAGGSMIFGSPLAIPSLGAGIESAKVHLSNEITLLQKRLRSRIDYFNKLCSERDIKLLSHKDSPIKYVAIGNVEIAIPAAEQVMSQGFHVNVTSYPAVPKKNCGIRVTLTVHHTNTDIEKLLNAIESAVLKNRQ